MGNIMNDFGKLNPTDEFGFTNDPSYLTAVSLFRDSAVADGWSIEPTYPNHESQERACRLRRDGFVMQVLTRSRDKEWQKYAYETHVSAWGPDGLALKLTSPYTWEQFQSALNTCNYCGKTGVQTQRVGFAGRCCDKCLPSIQKKLEYPGRTD